MSENKILKDGRSFHIKDIISTEIGFSLNEYFRLCKIVGSEDKEKVDIWIKNKIMEDLE